MKILFLGDIVGRLGCRTIAKTLPRLRKDDNIALCIGNADNIAGGCGVTAGKINEVLNCGVDYFTCGDHIFSIKSFRNEINNLPIIRPANYTNDTPGKRYAILDLGKLGRFLLVSLLGRTFMKVNVDCPFRVIDSVLKETENEDLSGIFVDFHAEATSEKKALGYYLDGRVSAIVGTHTHIPTSDAQILPNGTAYITDIGMVGAKDSVLGVKSAIAIQNFMSSMPKKFEWVERGRAVFNGVVIDYDERSRVAISIKSVNKEIE